MITKQLEILNKGNKRFALTVTPTRITIKLQDGSQEHDQRVIKFFKWIANQPEMLECLISFRGHTKIHPTSPLLLQMTNDNGKVKYTYHESNME